MLHDTGRTPLYTLGLFTFQVKDLLYFLRFLIFFSLFFQGQLFSVRGKDLKFNLILVIYVIVKGIQREIEKNNKNYD